VPLRRSNASLLRMSNKRPSNETPAQSRFASLTRNIPELGISENKAGLVLGMGPARG
jgi:hypothetical protein